MQAIDNFKKEYNENLEVLGVVATLVDTRTTLHTEVLQECRKFCKENNIYMFGTIIPRSVRFASAVAYENVPAALSSDRNNKLVLSYQELLEEIEEKGSENIGS